MRPESSVIVEYILWILNFRASYIATDLVLLDLISCLPLHMYLLIVEMDSSRYFLTKSIAMPGLDIYIVTISYCSYLGHMN